MPKEFIALLPGQEHCSRCCSLKVWTQKGCKAIQPLAGLLPKAWSHMAPGESNATSGDHAHNSRACLHLYPHRTGVSQGAIGVAAVCAACPLPAVQPHSQAGVTTGVSMASGAPSLCMDTKSSPYRVSWVRTVIKNCLPLY